MTRRFSRRLFLKGVAASATALSFSGGTWHRALAQTSIISVTQGTVDTMEPTRNNDPNTQLLSNIFDGLLRRDTQGNLQPALATSFEQVAVDQWEFTLREGVKFHNGNNFNAADVKFSLERLKEDFSERSFFGSMILEVQIIDDFKVRVVTDGSVPFLANIMHVVFILDSESSEGRSLTDLAQNAIGTGAYRLVDWTPSDFVELEANDDHWAGAPAIKRVRHQQISDDSTRFSALVSGDAQLVQSLPTQFAAQLDDNSAIDVRTRAGRQLIFFSPRVVDSPFSDVKVRQAAYHAIDSQLLVDTVLDGFAAPGSQIPDPATVGHNTEIQRLAFDQDRARDLLSEAGFADGFDLTVDVTNDQFVNDVGIGQAVAQQLQQVGINAQVRSRPSAAFFDDSDKEFFIVGWSDDAFDFGRTAGNLLVSGAFFNDSQYSNTAFDTLIDAANSSTDSVQRESLLRQANQVAMNDVALVPLHFEGNVWAASSNLNFVPRSDNFTIYQELVPGL
jgi:peptide/nickel transport system substrate-binding protein